MLGGFCFFIFLRQEAKKANANELSAMLGGFSFFLFLRQEAKKPTPMN